MSNPNLSKFTTIDLTNFDDSRLNEAGELSVSPYLRGPIFIQLGNNKLELTKINIDKPSPHPMARVAAYYTIRNLAVEQNDAATVILDDRLRFDSNVILHDREHAIYTRQSLLLGRHETPELELDDSAHDRHMLVKLGSLAGNLHFMDLANQPDEPPFISTVSLSPEDMQAISTPRRMYHVERDDNGQILSMETDEQRNGRWTRREF